MPSNRIRTLKPETLEDERVAALSANAFRLFVGCILLADDHGIFRAAPRMLERFIFWAAPDPVNIVLAFRELLQANLVTLYLVRGQQYAQLRGWKKHQKVNKPSKPRLPFPGDQEASHLEDLQEFLRDVPEIPGGIPGNSRPIPTTYVPTTYDQQSNTPPRPPTAAPDVPAGPPQLELVGDEPHEPRKKRKEGQKKSPDPEADARQKRRLDFAASVEHWQAEWIRAMRPADGKPPQPSRIDCNQLVRLLKAYTVDELRVWITRYVQDGDGFLLKQGHPLRLLGGRIDGYRATAAGGQRQYKNHQAPSAAVEGEGYDVDLSKP